MIELQSKILHIELNYLKEIYTMNANSVLISYCEKYYGNEKCVLLEFPSAAKQNTIGIHEGETIIQAFETAKKYRLPLVAKVTSAGMRITEGTLALMQMARIASVIKQHSDNQLLYIAIIDKYVLGGTSASLVALADIIIAEKNSIYGFTGKKIIEKTFKQKLPPDFQTSKFAMKHGMVDLIIDECEFNFIIETLLKLHR